MSESAIEYTGSHIGVRSSSKHVLRQSPHIGSLMRAGYLIVSALFVACVPVYLLPIHMAIKVGAIAGLAGVGLQILGYTVIMYERLARAVYTVTAEYVQSETGTLGSAVRNIPISYVRDVTYDQSFIQRMFGVSDIAVSPTNGDKIVLSNIRNGKETRNIIWKLVLSRSPQA